MKKNKMNITMEWLEIITLPIILVLMAFVLVVPLYWAHYDKTKNVCELYQEEYGISTYFQDNFFDYECYVLTVDDRKIRIKHFEIAGVIEVKKIK